MKKFFTLIGVFLFLFSFSAYSQITIDGNMSDWTNIPALDQNQTAETTGDITNANFDLKHMYVTSDTSNVYVKIDFADAASFSNYKNFPNEVLRFFMDTEIGTQKGLTQGWWNGNMSYWVDLGPNLNSDSTNKVGYLYYYTGDSTTTGLVADSKIISTVPMAVNSSQNSLEFSIPIDSVNFGQVFRAMVESSPDPSISNEIDYMPQPDNNYQVQYDFWYSGSVVQVVGAGINSSISIDGQMLDWVSNSIQRADTGVVMESLGDMPTGPEFDVADMYVTSDSEYLYVRFDIDPAATFSGMYTNYTGAPNVQLMLDTEFGDTTGLGYGGFWIEPVDYFVDLSAYLNPDSTGNTASISIYAADYDGAFETWNELPGVNALFAKNADDNAVEIAIPRKALHMGTDVRPWLYVVGDENWDNEEYVPNSAVQDWNGAGSDYYTINYNFFTGASVKRLGNKSTVTAIDNQSSDLSMVKGFGLVSNYPNPFNPSTTISFTLPRRNQVSLIIYNILGEKVRTLLDNKEMSQGVKNIQWNGKNSEGNTLASGVYLYRISSSDYSVTKKMMLLK